MSDAAKMILDGLYGFTAHAPLEDGAPPINEGLVLKAGRLFPAFARLAARAIGQSPCGRAALSVCGGSGTGKSSVAALAGMYLNELGARTVIVNGDNYPRRIPAHNDAERLRVFREGGWRGLIAEGLVTSEVSDALAALEAESRDADPACGLPWLASYQRAGREALARYLGSPAEQDFDEVNRVISEFKGGAKSIALKRMGRREHELCYEPCDISGASVLILEWTHGGSPYLSGLDGTLLLAGTPDETLERRRQRGRDIGVDSPFTAMVLAIEQAQIDAQASRASLIADTDGTIISCEDYRRISAGA